VKTGEVSDFPLETYRQLPYESKQFLKFIYRNLVLIQNSITAKKTGPKKKIGKAGNLSAKAGAANNAQA
jgi:hypothetical protein